MFALPAHIGSLPTPGIVALALLLTGCGAKTGLQAPDIDAGTTTLPPDAGVPIPCVEIPLDGGPVLVDLDVEAEVGRADVVFLVDTTLSMVDEIDRIRERLSDQMAPAIREAIPDSQLGVATFADFPVSDYGISGEDTPFRLQVPVTSDLARVQAAVDAIDLGNGADPPESQVEALYQLATGAGLGSYVPPSVGCPSGGVGYPCFRLDALPIVLLFTDAEFHNGPGGAQPYSSGSIFPSPHDYGQAVSVLNGLDARVIGFDSSGDRTAFPHLRAVGLDTGTVDSSGSPLVYDIGSRGESLGTQVVDAIRTFAGSVVQDIGAIPRDPDLTDGIDVLQFVDSIVPVRASPMSAIESIDTGAGLFRGVDAGVELTFQIVVRNDAVVPGTEPLRMLLEVVFRADERRTIGSRLVEIVIPAEDGSGCDD